MIPAYIKDYIIKNRQHWPKVVKAAEWLNGTAIRMQSASRELVVAMYPERSDVAETDFVMRLNTTRRRIEEVLSRYRNDDASFKYFHGSPYQGLGILGIFGDRVCDYRFDDYELGKFIKSGDKVLDIGCNCGFLTILASYRTGCEGHGIDINPYMIEIGQIAAEHLRLSGRVHLRATRIEDYQPTALFDVVMSFATHWTDDKNYRVTIRAHMERMAALLKPNGTLIFETHCNDLNSPEFRTAMSELGDLFAFDGLYKKTDSDTRELYIMKRV